MTGMFKRVRITPLKLGQSESRVARKRHASNGHDVLRHDAGDASSDRTVAVDATASGIIAGMNATASIYAPVKGKQHKPALKGALEGVRRSSDRALRRLHGTE